MPRSTQDGSAVIARASQGPMFWHPHQKLWNQRLVALLRHAPGGHALVFAVRTLDSLLLIFRVLARRIRELGPVSLLSPGPLPGHAIYVDCGLHKAGAQARLVAQWFSHSVALDIIGIEASPAHAADARVALADLPTVAVHQVALVGPDHLGATVRLYRAGRSGVGDSLFAERGETYDEVPAQRLSALLGTTALDGDAPVIVRMNIEGAEPLVIADIVDAGLVGRVAGWYGMWDDGSKIDPAQDAEFRAVMRRHHLNPVTFNQRDLKWRLRVWAIRYDLGTSLRLNKRHSAGKGWLRR